MSISAAIDEVLIPTQPKIRRRYSLAAAALPFVDQLPSHWRARKLKHVATVRFSSVDKKSEDGETPVRLCNYTDVYYRDRITPEIDFMEATADQSEIDRFTLRRGDVLVTKDSEIWSDIAVPAYVAQDIPGVLCGYHLAHIRPYPKELDGAFLSRAFAARGIREQFHIAANGITRYGLPNRAIAGALFPLPPLEEQRAIAAFLDRETAKIDELIAKKQRLLHTIQEKLSVEIDAAVTRGLELTRKERAVKESALTYVPESWSVEPLRRRWVVMDCKHRTVPFVDDGIPLASISEVQDYELDLTNAKMTTEDEYELMIEGGRQPRRGDIIYSRNATVGAAAIVVNDEQFCMGQDVCLIRSQSGEPEFLLYQLRSSCVMKQLESMMIGATFKRINVAQIKSLLVRVPPRHEQIRITAHCRTLRATLNGLIAEVAKAIDSLKEYRSALISAAVTGQIDVRHYREEAPCP